MKRFTVALTALLVCINAFSQADTIQPPYKKFPTYPPVKLLLPDSSGYYAKESLPKKMPVMLMLFNPACDHCKQETEDLVKNIDKFKDIQIVMATNVPLKEIRTFIEEYKLAQYKNIVVTQDTHYFLISFYQLHNFPFLAFYNKKKELISVFQGSMPMEKVLKQFGK
jgi:thioredoxin-related protein